LHVKRWLGRTLLSHVKIESTVRYLGIEVDAGPAPLAAIFRKLAEALEVVCGVQPSRLTFSSRLISAGSSSVSMAQRIPLTAWRP